MFSASTVVVAILVYMALLFVLAQWSERSATGKRLASHPIVFALGLAVYCTTWTYYGSVGKAATGGMGFLPVYLGPTLALLIGGRVFERIAQIKHAHRITSIADFVSARYAKSQAVAGLVTLLLTVGIVPYIALQIKAVTGSFAMLTTAAAPSALSSWFGPIIVVIMIVFTIIFGIRHLDPTERHPGMVVSLATESVMKLVAFLAAGAFVFGAAFGSFGKYSASLESLGSKLPLMGKSSPNDMINYVTVTLLSMAAFAFLPRQFHVGVVENSSPKHVRTAQWVLPLYLVAINVFVVPLALGGKLLATPGTSADFYVLALPIQAGKSALSLAVFVGGFSAAIGMIMVESMTMATMISNHIVIPLAQSWSPLRGVLRRTLQVRWVAAAGFIIAGYEFATKVGGSFPLVSIGLISFASAVVVAPVALGGLYWKSANRAGALLGLGSGFAVWFYTLLVPTFVKSGWVSATLLTHGPMHIEALRPEALFGLSGLSGLAHGSLWSVLTTVTFFVGGSVVFRASKDEVLLTEAFLGNAADQVAHLDHTHFTIDVAETLAKATAQLEVYFPRKETKAILDRISATLGTEGSDKMTVVQLAEIHGEIERTLAGAIGAASAHHAMKHLGGGIDRKDSKALEREFARTLAGLGLSPSELKKRIDFQKDREQLLGEQFSALQEKITERDNEIVERTKAEAALQCAHDELEKRVADRTAALASRERSMRLILDSTGDGLLPVALDGTLLAESSRSMTHWFGEPAPGASLWDYLAPDDRSLRESFKMAFEQLAEDVFPFELNADQMPSRVMRSGSSFDLEFKQVFEDGRFARVLVLVRDVTEKLAGERAEREAHEQRAIISRLLEDKQGFRSFVVETERLFGALAVEQDLCVIKRQVHTLKGNAGFFGFTSLAHRCHEVEDLMIECGPSPEDLASLRSVFVSRLESIGIPISEDARATVEVRESDIAKLVDRIRSRGDRDELLEVVESWRWAHASEHLARLRMQAQSIAGKLDKKVNIRVVHNGLRLPPAQNELDAFWPTLIHVVQNMVDHGIETPEIRLAQGKPETGELMFATKLADDGALIVEVADDGKGVDAAAVVAAAARKGIVLSPDEEPIHAIFADGLSTREDVTSTSGRGVGLAAVRRACLAAGGSVRVETELGKGTVFSFRFPQVVAPRSRFLTLPPRRSALPPAA